MRWHAEFLPAVVKALQEREVKLYIDEQSRELLGDKGASIAKATERHYATEFLGLEMAVRVVESLEEAVEHIARLRHGSLGGNRHPRPEGQPAIRRRRSTRRPCM